MSWWPLALLFPRFLPARLVGLHGLADQRGVRLRRNARNIALNPHAALLHQDRQRAQEQPRCLLIADIRQGRLPQLWDMPPDEDLLGLVGALPCVPQIISDLLEGRRQHGEVAGNAQVVVAAGDLLVVTGLQFDHTGCEGRAAVVGDKVADEIGHHARIVPPLLLAPPAPFQVLVAHGIGNLDQPGGGAGGVVRHVFTGADQQAADLAGFRRRGIAPQTAAGRGIGVSLQ